MENLVDILNGKIESIKSEQKSIYDFVNITLINKTFIRLLSFEPDSLNIDEIRQRVPKEYLSKVEYIEKLIGWFRLCPDEPQIKLAIEYLNEISTVLLSKSNSSIKLAIKLYQKYEQVLKHCNELLKKIETYDCDTYIDEIEFLVLENLITDRDINDELIKQFLYIGKNNALIKTGKNNRNFNNDFDSCTKLITRVKDIIKDSTFLTKLVGNIKVENDILICFRQLEIIEKQITDEMLEEAKLFKNEIEIIDDENTFIIAIVLLLLEALKQKNTIIIKDILEKYQKSKFYQQINIENSNGITINQKKLQKWISYYYNDEEYNRFISSYGNIPELTLNDFVDLKTIQRMKIMQLIHDNCSAIDELSNDQLENFIIEIEQQIDIYNNMQSDIDSQIADEKEGLTIDDVLNYVVFLNPKRIKENIDNIIWEYSDVKLSLFVSAIHKLLMIPQNDLHSRDTCKPIIVSTEYEIREERAGNIRICFRDIGNVDGHHIYEILSFAYGYCNGKKKSDNLRQSLKEYTDHYDEYQALEKIFYENDLKKMYSIVEQGLCFYNELSAKDKGERCITNARQYSKKNSK